VSVASAADPETPIREPDKLTFEFGWVSRGTVASLVVRHSSIDRGDALANGAYKEREPKNEGSSLRSFGNGECPHREDDLAYHDL